LILLGRRDELETVFPTTVPVVRVNTVFFMKIHINGEEKKIADGLNIAGLLDQLEIRPGRVVVELNRAIISRETQESTSLKEGDVLEIVHFVGGG
jgi:thiazole synthase